MSSSLPTQAEIVGGRYKIGKLLGYGHTAEVHEAYDMRLGRNVAMKRMHQHVARRHGVGRKFREEIQLLGFVHHPNVATIYDIGFLSSDSDIPYYVAELVSGRNFRQILADQGKLSFETAVEVVRGVASGLSHLHRNSIVHRDISPENVMLSETGFVMIVDFGLAALQKDNHAAQATELGSVYMPPELLRGEDGSSATDIYELGCFLFELLCGRPPFVGPTLMSIAFQHVSAPRPSLRALGYSDLSVVDAILEIAMAIDPAARYDSVAAFANDLNRFASGQAPKGMPISAEYSSYRLSAQNLPESQGVNPSPVGNELGSSAPTWSSWFRKPRRDNDGAS